jgi:hypothetical protein
MRFTQIFLWIVFGALLYTSANAAEFCIDITEDDESLIAFTDEKGWNESLGISRLTFAKDKLMEFLLVPIANMTAIPRKREEMEKIEAEERQKAAMQLAPKVRITNDVLPAE